MNHKQYFEQLAFECACEKEQKDEDMRVSAQLTAKQEFDMEAR